VMSMILVSCCVPAFATTEPADLCAADACGHDHRSEAVGDVSILRSPVCTRCNGGVLSITRNYTAWVTYDTELCQWHPYGIDEYQSRTGTETTRCNNCGLGSTRNLPKEYRFVCTHR
jgi:predicted nucleic acid-binding Zn ribbon protein